MKTEQQRVSKLLDKAHSYSNAILKEMYEIYGHSDQPYFLHVMLNQCALGLRYLGCDKQDLFRFITEVFDKHPAIESTPDLSGFTILEQTRLYTNNQLLKLQNDARGASRYAARGHIKPSGWLTEERYLEILGKFSKKI